MKCPHCGANINLEDEYCAYCGKPNAQAKKHIAEMRHYRREYSKTQEEIYTKSKRVASLTAPLVILIIMIVLNIAAFIFNVSSWDIGQSMLEKKIEARAEDHQAKIDAYLADGDYHGLSSYYNTNNLYVADRFDRYTAVIQTADNYFTVYRELVNLPQEKESSYYKEDLPSKIKRIADNVEYIFSAEQSYTYRAEEYLAEDMLTIIHAIQDQTSAVLIAYAGLTPEEAAEVPNYSSSRLMELLERGLAVDEE